MYVHARTYVQCYSAFKLLYLPVHVKMYLVWQTILSLERELSENKEIFVLALTLLLPEKGIKKWAKTQILTCDLKYLIWRV